MELSELSPKEILIVCHRAECKCAERFHALAARLSDPDVSRLMERLAQDEEAHAKAMDRLEKRTEWPRVLHLDWPRIEEMIRHHIPELGRPLAPGPIESGEALRNAEAVEAGSTRFYRTLAEVAPDGPTREFFRRVAEEENGHLEDLHLLDN